MTIKDDFRGGPDAAPSSSVSPAEADAWPQDMEDFCEPDDNAGSIFGLRPKSALLSAVVHADAEAVVPASTADSLSLPPTVAPEAYEPEEQPTVFGLEAEPEPVLPVLHDASSFEPLEQPIPDFWADPPLDSGSAPPFEPLEPLTPGLPSDEETGEFSEEQEESKKDRWLGIRFRKTGQVYFYPDTEHTVRIGTKVLVRQEHGPALGEVESIIHSNARLAGGDPAEQGKVLGLATAQDIARHTENSILAAEAEAYCKTCIRQRGLDMKLVDVEVLHDRSKIIFFFTAPTRIDFRELVKDLVRNYRTRIELRQIGVRHETQMIGGLGNCGMVCCCHRYLRKFAPVTIKMAKEQNLFLNPAKLSGMCGRLLCCLSFEQGNYEEFNRRCPKIGKKYATVARGTVKVLRANMFSQSIVVLSDTGEETEVSLEEWEGMEPRRAEPGEYTPSGQRASDEQTQHGRQRNHQQQRESVPDDEAALTRLENESEPLARKKEDRPHPKGGGRHHQKRGR